MNTILQRLLSKVGVVVLKKGYFDSIAANNEDIIQNGLRRLKMLNIIPRTIVDIGAAEGTWTVRANSVFNESQYLLFEPLVERLADLERLKDTIANRINIAPFAAGNKVGILNMMVTDDLDGSAIVQGDRETNPLVREIGVSTVDAQLQEFNLQAPYGLKLDTHGFELPVFEGATRAVDNAIFIIVECYLYNITNDCLLFPEMCAFLKTKGFRLFDVVDSLRRPTDKALWQVDAIFIKANHFVFSKNTYA